MKNTSSRYIALVIATLLSSAANSAVFEYQLLMQAETSLDQGPVHVAGMLVNTGTVTLNAFPQGTSLAGLPSNLNQTTNWCGFDASACLISQFPVDGTLAPGESFSFTWLAGTQEENISGYAGLSLSGLLAFVPLNSDWVWTEGGHLTDLIVESLWVNGPANMNLPFHVSTINLAIAGQYISGSPLTEVPLPATVWLFGSGLLALLGISRKTSTH